MDLDGRKSSKIADEVFLIVGMKKPCWQQEFIKWILSMKKHFKIISESVQFGMEHRKVSLCFFPNEITLGFSAIGKVSGQLGLYGSLGQIRLGLPKGSAEGSTEVLEVSWFLSLWGRSVLGCQKVPRKVPPRFRQGFTKVPPRFSKFRGVSGSLGQIRVGLPKGSAEGSTKVSPRFHQGSTEVLEVSWCLWLSGADPCWAAKRFRGRFRQGFTKVPPRFSKFRGVSGSLVRSVLGWTLRRTL